MSILTSKHALINSPIPYQLAISQSKAETFITMTVSINQVHTNHFPSTYNILKANLPSVLKTKCFNDRNLPFDKEVLNTELGHLFEHILLQYLCNIKLKKGAKYANFKGVTHWNWKKDAPGTFHITLYASINDWQLFPEALEMSQKLLNKIIFSPIVAKTAIN